MTKLEKIGTALELGGILVLTGISFDSIYKAYKEACKRIDLEAETQWKDIRLAMRDIEIDILKKEVQDLKDKYEPAEKAEEEA